MTANSIGLLLTNRGRTPDTLTEIKHVLRRGAHKFRLFSDGHHRLSESDIRLEFVRDDRAIGTRSRDIFQGRNSLAQPALYE